jgi:Membrane-fusion protein
MGKRRALSVPRDALQRLSGSGTYYVFVVDGNKSVKRTVQMGVIEEQLAEVRDGLAQGEKVVTSGAGRLRTGAEIIVQDLKNKNETDKSQGTTSQDDRR